MVHAVKLGDVRVGERTFTGDDVAAFVRVSGDAGAHHLVPDARGRLVVHGLLTASLATRLGGDLGYLARTMAFDFRRPVYTGDTVRCELTITRAEDEPGRQRIALTVRFTNQDGEVVLTGESDGVIPLR